MWINDDLEKDRGLKPEQYLAEHRKVVRYTAEDMVLHALPNTETPEMLKTPQKYPDGVFGINMRALENADINQVTDVEKSRIDIEEALKDAA
jgi:hypothetical protein